MYKAIIQNSLGVAAIVHDVNHPTMASYIKDAAEKDDPITLVRDVRLVLADPLTTFKVSDTNSDESGAVWSSINIDHVINVCAIEC